MARKTADVMQIRRHVNRALSHAPALMAQEEQYGEEGARAYRAGVIAVLETVLFDTGNYHGYQCTDGQQGKRDESIRRYF